jgi:transaldolase
MTKLHDLYAEQGQSPWLDNLKRGWITSGELAEWVDRGVRGITSNPSIFQKAIGQSADYDEQLGDLVSSGTTVEDAYWDLVTTDIADALRILAPVHAADHDDGFVSVEVAPDLARDTDGTIASARALHTRIDEPNLLVKIPGTAEGVPAIRQMVSEGRNINVTLLFSIERYAEIIEAYMAGLEAFDGDLATVHGVASFFVSRVDTEVDRRLEEIGTEAALALRGQAAVANARVAYALFLEQYAGARWAALAARGANVQRPLWASTSTKNKAYSDTLYVDELIGPRTVNTIPDATIDSFEDHGTLHRTLDTDLVGAQVVLDQVGAVGVDVADVAVRLEDEGVASFAKAFDELLDTLGGRVEEFGG